MSIKLVMLKSGEDIIADVKEIKSNDDVVGYYFNNPLIIKLLMLGFSLGFHYQKIMRCLVQQIG